MNDMNFGYNNVEDKQTHTGARAVPDSGDYNVMISDIQMESNSRQDGHNIVVTYSILDGDYAGSEVKEWLAVINKSDTAQNIAQSKLKSIYITTGKTSASSFTELQGAVLRIRLYKKEHQWTDNDGNSRDGYNTEVAMYMDTDGNNANGKEVPQYSGPAVIASKGKSNANRRPDVSSQRNQNQNQNQSYQQQDDDDSEIPF